MSIVCILNEYLKCRRRKASWRCEEIFGIDYGKKVVLEDREAESRYKLFATESIVKIMGMLSRKFRLT
jgi:hypothetical protein